MADPSFARPTSELSTPLLSPPEVSAAPSAGQGFSLNAQGHIPVVAKDGQWTMEYVSVAVNITSTLNHANNTPTVSIPGLQVNDLCFLIGSEHGATRNSGFIKYTEPLCTTEGQITLACFNAESGTVDPTSATFHFLVIHRFIPS